MLFMVVERFAPGRLADVYGVVRERGRMLPDGLMPVTTTCGPSPWVSTTRSAVFRAQPGAIVSLLIHRSKRIWKEKFEMTPASPAVWPV